MSRGAKEARSHGLLRHCVCVGGGGGATRYFKWIRDYVPTKNFKIKYQSLLIRFIMTIDGKYKTS